VEQVFGLIGKLIQITNRDEGSKGTLVGILKAELE